MSEVGSRQVAEFSNHYLNSRRLHRSMKNPMDKCTIVSIFPLEINEDKVTIEPGKFHLDSGTFESPSVLVVGSSSWWKEIDLDQPMLEIPTSSVAVAESIVKDYCNGMLAWDGDGGPGLFFVLGEVKKLDIKLKYSEKLKEVRDKQDVWFHRLVKIADSLWARTNGNPLVVWDLMRLAARSLNLNDKPWLKDYITIEKVKCLACGNLKDPAFPVCGVCRAIDNSHPSAKDLKFAV